MWEVARSHLLTLPVREVARSHLLTVPVWEVARSVSGWILDDHRGISADTLYIKATAECAATQPS